MTKFSFSGHESFICKQFWLKKGVDFLLQEENSFTSDEAVVRLGVGKNMVRSIRFWLRAFGITDDNDELQDIGRYIFLDNGTDPYIESIGSTWLLHYLLISTNKASIYSLLFNDFRRVRPEFKVEQLQNYIARICKEGSPSSYNENTVKRDIRVMLNSYLPPSISKRSEIEDSFSGLLYEVRLVGQKSKFDLLREEKVTYYIIESDFRDTLPCEIVLYSILDNPNFGRTITFQDLYSSPNSPGNIFALNQDGLYEKIVQILEKFPECSYSETAGNKVLQISSKLTDKYQVLDAYYNQ